MNRKNLTAAVLAGLAGVAGIVGSAQAVNINPDGLGQVLLYPYYTTNGGNVTVLSVVNTTGQAKAVKVRFLEGENSREVLDFNLYMSKYDVWTAALVDIEGTPTLITRDTSCTVPYIYGNGGVQEFLPYALNDAEYLDRAPKNSTQLGPISKVYGDISRGAEGHMEMIEMGTLVNESEANPLWVNEELFPFCVAGSPVEPGNPSGECLIFDREWTDDELDQPETLTDQESAKAATHTDGVPNDCQQLVDAWTVNLEVDDDGNDVNGYWIDEPFIDIDPPSGGMFGGGAIVNVELGAMYSYDARAIDGFFVQELQDIEDFYTGDPSHQEPGTILPSLDSGNTTRATIFFRGQTLRARWPQEIDLGPDETLARSVDAVSYVLMHDAIMNEYTTEVDLLAATEWVITFPTKQFYVHQAFLDRYAEYREEQGEDGDGIDPIPLVPVRPFTSTWTWVNTEWETDEDGDFIIPAVVEEEGYVDRPCEVVQLDSIYDREERTIVDEDNPGNPIPPIVSPAPPIVPNVDGIIPFELCYETSVISFGDPDNVVDGRTSILGSRNFHNIDNSELGFEHGWARLDLFDATSDIDEDGDLDKLFRKDLGGLVGLPVTGFAVNRYINAFIGDNEDVLANYGGIFQHKGTRGIDSARSGL